MNFFICSTPYHIFVSICLLSQSKDKGVFYLTSHDEQMTKEFYKYKQKLLELNIAEKVYIRKRKKLHERFFIENIKDRLQFKKYKADLEKSNVYLFPWNPYSIYTIANFLFNRSKNIYLVEDASNVYQYQQPSTLNLFIKKNLYGVNTNFFYDEKLKSILVQYPEKYPIFLKNKLALLDLKVYLKNLKEKERQQIINVFMSESAQRLVGKRNENKSSSIIILTQPLSEDGFISEDIKKNAYQNIIKKYGMNYTVFIKKHPREKTKYNFEDVIEIEGGFPSEILRIMDIEFVKAIGICTSAVDLILAEEKINTQPEFFERGFIDE